MEGVQSRLKACPERVSWVGPGNRHLTLKFLGDTARERVPPLVEALGKVSSGIDPFELCSNGLGAFPSMRVPRILWLGMDESGELLRLKCLMEEALYEAGFERDKKTFRPHLTLCRIRSKKGSRAMGAMAEAIKVEKKVAFVVTRFVLYKSTLRPAGAQHEVIREFPLRGGAV